MEALIVELGELRVPDLPEYEPDEVAFGEDRNTAFYEVLDAYGRVLRLGDLMWQHHFEFLLLGYGAYATFAELCKTHLPDIPDQHIAQMVAGIDVLLFKPDAELRRLARLAIDTGVDGAFVEGRTPGRDRRASSAQSEAGQSWLAELEKVKDPWFNMATGDGLYHYYRSWLDDPSIPYASLIGHIAALRAGEQIDRPTEEIERERDRLAEEYGALLDEETRGPWNDLLALSRTVFPYVEEHKFFCDYWFLTRWWNKMREFGALLATHGFLEDGEDIFQLSRHEVASALDELVLTWATGGQPLGPQHWPPIVAARRQILERLAQWTPPPALGVTPDGDHRSDDDHALGGDDRARAGVGAPAGRRLGAERSRGIARRRRGSGTGRASGQRDRGRARRRDPRLRQHLARVGADLLEDQGDRHRRRRRDVARRDRVSRVRAAGGRRHRARDLADSHRSDDPGRRDGRRGDAPRLLLSGPPGRTVAIRFRVWNQIRKVREGPARSAQQPPAVDEQRLAGHERAVVRDQETERSEQIRRLADPAQRRAAHVVSARAGQPARSLGGDEPRGERVDPDAVGAELAGQASRQADDRRLRGDVVREPRGSG